MKIIDTDMGKLMYYVSNFMIFWNWDEKRILKFWIMVWILVIRYILKV